MPNTHTTLTGLFSDIADAIRAKTGDSADIVADDFPDAIGDIETGITPTGKITITENGTGIDVSQYATADVNVSGGERSKWFRPADWPDYDSLVLSPTAEEIFLTIDTQYGGVNVPHGLYIACTSPVRVDRGHISGGQFVADEFIGEGTLASYNKAIPLDKGRFLVYRISNMTRSFSPSSSYTTYGSYGSMPVVEVFGNNSYGSTQAILSTTVSFTEKRHSDFSSSTASSNDSYISIQNLDMSGCNDTGSVDMYQLLDSCSIPVIKLPNMTNVTRIAYFNYSNRLIDELDLSVITSNHFTTLINFCRNMSSLRTLNISGLDFSEVTNTSNAFGGDSNLENIITDEDTVMPPINFSMTNCSKLTDQSLINIANALPLAAATWTINTTPKGRLITIMGTVSGGVFTADASGTVTLQNFITQTKGWTIA